MDTAERKYAEEALADANAARGMLPDNALVLSANLYARTIAAGIYQEAGLPEQRRSVLEEAARDVQALQPFIALPNPAVYMWTFYKSIGDRDRALDVARRSLEASGSPLAAYICAVDLYQQGRFAEALKCLDRRRQGEMLGDVMRAFVLAESPDGPRLALQEHDKITRKYPLDPWSLRFCRDILLLLGKKELALASFKKFGSVPGLKSEGSKKFFEAVRQFGCGELSEEGFLIKAGTSRNWQYAAHLDIALFRLAAGDRRGARKHFQMAISTRAYWYYDSFWCLMFLSRLEEDPTWPKWIGPMKGNKKP
jgi:hypothetical protein